MTAAAPRVSPPDEFSRMTDHTHHTRAGRCDVMHRLQHCRRKLLPSWIDVKCRSAVPCGHVLKCRCGGNVSAALSPMGPSPRCCGRSVGGCATTPTAPAARTMLIEAMVAITHTRTANTLTECHATCVTCECVCRACEPLPLFVSPSLTSFSAFPLTHTTLGPSLRWQARPHAPRVLRGTRAREEKIRSSARLLQRLDGPTVPVHLLAATACPTAAGCLTSAGCAVGAESPRAPATAMETCWTSAGYVQTS